MYELVWWFEKDIQSVIKAGEHMTLKLERSPSVLLFQCNTYVIV